MLELAADLLPVLRAGSSVAVVTVTRVIRSAPRGVGASLAVTEDLRIIGSISGGCVENDAVLQAAETLRTGRSASARFGFGSDGSAPAGLACGGAVEVISYRLTPSDETAVSALESAASDSGAAVGIVLTGHDAGTLLSAALMHDEAYDPSAVLVLTRPSRPRLMILGADEHAAALCRVASAVGYAVTVCDSWGLLVTPERFPDAATLVVARPEDHLRSLDPSTLDDRDAICVLTHDEREDVPALRVALGLPVGFVGAMGARPTVARREALLRARGVSTEARARLHSPLGLDLGGTTPAETALAVLAEIAASRHGATALPLRDVVGPIHRGRADDEEREVAASCSLVPQR